MRVIEIGDDYDRALVSGFVAREETRSRIDRDRDLFRDRVSRHRGREYLERFEDRSRALDIDLLARRSISIGRRVQSAFRDDMIFDLHSVGDFQHSSTRIQDYLLSVPQINYRARNQRMEAWGRPTSDYAYRDDEDPRHNPYYRAMHDGYLQVCPDDPTSMYAESYLGQTEADMELLSHDEKMTLHRSAALLLDLLDARDSEDPTSPQNNLL